MTRRLIVVAFLGALLFPGIALMQSSQIPEFNPLCWKQNNCQDQRNVLLRKPKGDKAGANGWHQESPCVGDWGKCLPAGVSETEIAFGGKNEFLHIGDFIQTIYKYAVGVAGIIAVVMIVVAGFQWVSSAGNSEVITSAKKRIGGALIGLFIAYASYFILSTINPALVNLRLPQVYMLRPFQLLPKFCSAASSNTKFAFAAGGDVATVPPPTGKETFDLKYGDLNKSDNTPIFACGSRFYMEGGGNSTCQGDICDAGKMCLPFTVQNNNIVNKTSCLQGQLVIHYLVSDAGESLGQSSGVGRLTLSTLLNGPDWLDTNNTIFYAVCQTSDGKKYIGNNEKWDGTGAEHKLIVPIKKTSLYEYYIIYSGFDTAHGQDHWQCNKNSGDKFVGFIYKGEVHPRCGWIGCPYDNNVVIGQTPGQSSVSRQGAVGFWQGGGSTNVDAANYIPYDDMIGKGVYLDASFGSDLVEGLKKKGGSSNPN